MAALWAINSHSEGKDRLITVEDYFKASGEVLALTLVATGAMTALFRPEVLRSNPLRDRVGYNNACVFFDEPPANWFGAISTTYLVHLILIYCQLDTRRLQLARGSLPRWYLYLGYACNMLYAVSACVFCLVFVVPPTVSVWGHTLLFVQYIVCRWVAVASNYLEGWILGQRFSRGAVAFACVYTACSFVLPILYITSLVEYDRAGFQTGEHPYFSPYFVMTVDYAWFACLPLTTKFLPDAPPLRQRTQLATQGRGGVSRGDIGLLRTRQASGGRDWAVVPNSEMEHLAPSRHSRDEGRYARGPSDEASQRLRSRRAVSR